jgi:hypothetical protein
VIETKSSRSRTQTDSRVASEATPLRSDGSSVIESPLAQTLRLQTIAIVMGAEPTAISMAISTMMAMVIEKKTSKIEI